MFESIRSLLRRNREARVAETVAFNASRPWGKGRYSCLRDALVEGPLVGPHIGGRHDRLAA